VQSSSVPSDLWDPDSTDGVLEPLTPDKVSGAEQLLGVKLPSALIELLSRQNGGKVAAPYRACPTDGPTSWAPDHVPFESCNGIGEGFRSLTESPYLNEEWGQPREFVLLVGDGHWWVALDYRDRTEPSVVWFDNEVGQDITLAPTFPDFLDKLAPTPPVGA